MKKQGEDFRGNKAFLDSKPCAHCGRTMTWRKRWALNWDCVKYCSDACRQDSGRRGRGGGPTAPRSRP